MVELIREHQEVVINIIASLIFFVLFLVTFELIYKLNIIDIKMMT